MPAFTKKMRIPVYKRDNNPSLISSLFVNFIGRSGLTIHTMPLCKRTNPAILLSQYPEMSPTRKSFWDTSPNISPNTYAIGKLTKRSFQKESGDKMYPTTESIVHLSRFIALF